MFKVLSIDWLFFGHTNDFRLKYAIQSFKHAFTYSGCNVYGFILGKYAECLGTMHRPAHLGLRNKGFAM